MLKALLRDAQKKVYPKHTMIINEGDRPSCAYVINSGKVEILLCDEQGKEVVLSVLGRGAHFGEMSLIDDVVRSAAVKAREDTELTLISKENFRQCLRSHPEIAEQIMRGLVGRLREANKKISGLALMDVHERVAHLLESSAVEKNGEWVIEEKLTQQFIANTVGASREMVSRIMRNMVEEGAIRMDRRRIILLDKPSGRP